MRAVVLKVFIVALLFVNVEGAAESVDENSFHQAHHAHADDVGDQWFPDSDGEDHEGDACEHFCHAHGVVLSSDVKAIDIAPNQFFVVPHPTLSISRAAAPPIPPPNI